jgi:hypothetical protein
MPDGIGEYAHRFALKTQETGGRVRCEYARPTNSSVESTGCGWIDTVERIPGRMPSRKTRLLLNSELSRENERHIVDY